MLIFLAFLITSLVLKPLKEKTEMVTLVINDFLYILALLSFLMYHFKKDSLTEKERYNHYGFLIIGILAAIVATNLLIGFYVCIEQVNISHFHKFHFLRLEERATAILRPFFESIVYPSDLIHNLTFFLVKRSVQEGKP